MRKGSGTVKNCNQAKCDNPSAFTFVWPGKDRDGICVKHVGILQAMANAMGAPIYLRPITVADLLSETETEGP